MTATLLPRENVRFLLGPAPTLVLAAAPFHADLPPLGPEDGGSSGWPKPSAPCDGWRIMPRLTLCLLDGPDGAGCLIPTLREPTDMGAMLDWCAAVDAAGGAIVVSLKGIPDRLDWAEILADGEARGGFLPEMAAQSNPAHPAAP